jgi:hypothetical protein
VKNASSVNKGKFDLNDMKSADWWNDNGVMPQGNQLGIGAALQSSSKRFRLDMQSDGNLVLYKEPEHRPIWHTDTVGKGGYRANLQHDGNFVVYTESSVPIWNSRTQGMGTNYLMLQDDGNLVLYAVDKYLLMDPSPQYAQWSTGTNGMKKATNSTMIHTALVMLLLGLLIRRQVALWMVSTRRRITVSSGRV